MALVPQILASGEAAKLNHLDLSAMSSNLVGSSDLTLQSEPHGERAGNVSGVSYNQ